MRRIQQQQKMIRYERADDSNFILRQELFIIEVWVLALAGTQQSKKETPKKYL